VRRVRALAAALALCATAAAGCGLGPGEDEGEVRLTVTRDYGSEAILQETDSIDESDTVIRVLDRNAEITTRYGGGFIQSIDGLAGSQSAGRRSDWFFYVNGIESPIGSAEYDPGDGDRIWWDYRDWTAAMRVPAVVGSWPEPFVHGFEGKRWQTFVDCVAVGQTCEVVDERVLALGRPVLSVVRRGARHVKASGNEGIHMLVGPWSALRADPVGRLLAQPPRESGVFAQFVGTKRALLEVLNTAGQPAGSIGKGGGLIAALRPDEGPPTWVVTGTDAKGVAAAANLLGDQLRNHYAVAVQPGAGAIGVPVP
jgi:Domain of unknown function (DUF4430)